MEAVTAKGLAAYPVGKSVFDFPLPAAVLSRDALEHNIATMARYCAAHDVLLAPHGRTTMCPQIIQRQLAAGAWAITVATAWQAQAVAAMGVRRLLLANEVVDAGSLRLLAWLLSRYDDLELYCYADSPAALDALASVEPGDRLRVLVELGLPGGRTGVRDDAEALALARRVAQVPGRLAGFAAFEGLLDAGCVVETLRVVDRLLERLAAAALAATDLAGPAPVVTAGGSAYVDRIVTLLPPALASSPYRIVARSGCYVTHDAGLYATLSPFGDQPRAGYRLREALRIWAPVLSRPEPTRALAGLGRRDVSSDAGLPVPRLIRSRSLEQDATGLAVVNLNDQHAHLEVPAEHPLAVGDLICFGISHPCTTFDKWRAIPIVDSTETVIDIAYTHF